MAEFDPARDIRVLRDPTVYLLGRQVVNDAELDRFLADHGVSWQTDTEVAAEYLAEVAGRVCFDEATEVLTSEGWKRFAELNGDEAVLTLNPRTQLVEFQHPTAYQVYTYRGILKCAEGRDVSFAVTPEHRQWGSFEYWRKAPPCGFVATADIGDRRFKILSAPKGWNGSYPRFIDLPEVQYTQRVSNQFGRNYGIATKTIPNRRITGRARLRALAILLTYYAAEGSLRDHPGSGRGLSIYGDHVKTVASLCRALDLPCRVYKDPRNGVERVIVGGGLRLVALCKAACGLGSAAKKLPSWVLNLPSEVLAEVWRCLVITDGHHYQQRGREVLITTSPVLAGQAQEILCKLGYSSSVLHESDGVNHPVLRVSKKLGRPIYLNDKVRIKDRYYRGKVYCVTTPNGIVYVRRNGRVHFSGNCYMSFAKPRPGGNKAYLGHILEVAHGSVLEHAVWNFLFTGCSRSLTHELIRHRHMSYSQLSQRYVDESAAEYVEPDCIADDPDLHRLWLDAVAHAHRAYVKLVEGLQEKFKDEPDRTLRRKLARQAARSVLPNATETKIFVTANARALRHFIELRGSRHAETEIRKLAIQVLRIMQNEAPNLFADYQLVPLPDGTFEAVTEHRKV